MLVLGFGAFIYYAFSYYYIPICNLASIVGKERDCSMLTIAVSYSACTSGNGLWLSKHEDVLIVCTTVFSSVLPCNKARPMSNHSLLHWRRG